MPREAVRKLRPEADAEKWISLEVTEACNLACTHCFARVGTRKVRAMSGRAAREILTEAQAAGYRGLHITGGEPLLWKGLWTALDRAMEMGYARLFLNTNGTLLSPEICRRLAGYPGLSLSVSLDGPANRHDRLRGLGSHRKACAGLANALEAGMTPVVFSLAGKRLLADLPYFVAGLYRHFNGMEYVALIEPVEGKRAADPLLRERLGPLDFIRLVQLVAWLNLGGFRCLVLYRPLAAAVSGLLGLPTIPATLPEYHFGSLFVRSDLGLGLSHTNPLLFGRYEKGMIERLLASADYRRAVAPDEIRCPRCRHFRRCRGNGQVRPVVSDWGRNVGDLYCRIVMDLAFERSPAATRAPESTRKGLQ